MSLHETEPGISLYYESFGGGQPLIFTSSGNASHAMWDEQVAFFAPNYLTVTYDWRGTGKSSKPPSGYSAEKAATDLLSLAQSVSSELPVLVGHGMGAHISLLAALNSPKSVSGLVLANGGPWYTGTKDGVSGGMSEEFLAIYENEYRSYPDTLAEVVQRWMFVKQPSTALTNALIIDGLSWSQHVSNEYNRDMWDLDFRSSLGQLHIPTLVIHGRHDQKQRYSGAPYLAKSLPQASLVTLEHSAHCAHLEQAPEWNQALAKFLSRLL